MRVLMRRGTVGPEGQACEVGEVYDLPDAVARHWIAIGRAVAMDTPAPMAPTVLVTHGDPVVQHAEPPKRRRR